VAEPVAEPANALPAAEAKAEAPSKAEAPAKSKPAKAASPAEKPVAAARPAEAVVPAAEKIKPEKKPAAEKPAAAERPAKPAPESAPKAEKKAAETAAPAGGNNAQLAAEAYQRGNAKLLSGALPEAIAAFSEAIKLNPKDAQSQRGLGLAYAQSGKAPLAVRHLKLYLKIAPGAPDRALIEKRIEQLSGR
jgi:tetratricopeptide (TPR) repeat protein